MGEIRGGRASQEDVAVGCLESEEGGARSGGAGGERGGGVDVLGRMEWSQTYLPL